MEEIINKLRLYNEILPRQALIESVNRKEEITQPLLDELDKIIVSSEMAGVDEEYMLQIYAVYLLAQFREKRAFRPIIRLISLPPDEVDSLLGDVVTEGLSPILYSTFDGNLNLLQAVIGNPLLNTYARGAALDTYGKLYSDGVISKEECIAYLRTLIYDVDFDIATYIQGVVIDRHIFEMIDDIQYLYDQDRIDTDVFGKYDEFIDFMYSHEHNREPVRYIEDIIQEISWWACFEQSENDKIKARKKMDKLYESLDKEEKLIKDAMTRPKKTGRNDPCPCQSGKKYKKCCLAKKQGLKKDYLESLEEQKRWLRYYPQKECQDSNNEIRFYNIYDQESIDIDRLVYLALHHRPMPIWMERDTYKEDMVKISYLIKAYTKFIVKCKKEAIGSFSAYDKKYKIHYRSKEWVEKLKHLIIKNELEDVYKDVLENLRGQSFTNHDMIS